MADDDAHLKNPHRQLLHTLSPDTLGAFARSEVLYLVSLSAMSSPSKTGAVELPREKASKLAHLLDEMADRLQPVARYLTEQEKHELYVRYRQQSVDNPPAESVPPSK